MINQTAAQGVPAFSDNASQPIVNHSFIS